jgi:hypothetical protein
MRATIRTAATVTALALALAPAAASAQETPAGEPTPAPVEPESPRRYGDAGTSEVNILLGLSSAGVALGGGFRYFVVDALAPGLEGAVYRVDGVTYGYSFGSLRVVPLRFEKFALVLTGRAGRVFLSEHSDGWAYGGDAGVVFLLGKHVGLELGWEVLKLAPASFCADLSDCIVQRPVVGVRIVF